MLAINLYYFLLTGQLNRRHSMDPDQDRRRHASGSAYIRGEDPEKAAQEFRESRRVSLSQTLESILVNENKKYTAIFGYRF